MCFVLIHLIQFVIKCWNKTICIWNFSQCCLLVKDQLTFSTQSFKSKCSFFSYKGQMVFATQFIYDTDLCHFHGQRIVQREHITISNSYKIKGILHHCVVIFNCVSVCRLHLKLEFLSCVRGVSVVASFFIIDEQLQ